MKKWFYNGTFMPDGRAITVAARSAPEEEVFLKRGFRPVELSGRLKHGTRALEDGPAKEKRKKRVR